MHKLREKYPTREIFMEAYSPDLQAHAASYPNRSFFGVAPTLAELNQTYGEQSAAIWLVPQLVNFSFYCGLKDQLTDDRLRECATQIAANFGYLKVSELLLFFHRAKSCKYGKFYNLSPMSIIEALRKFIDNDRKYAYEKYESFLTQKRIDEDIEQNRQSVERNPDFDPMQLPNFRMLHERYGTPQ